MPSIEQFDAYIKQLCNHDWFYDYSDDVRIYRAGKESQDRLHATSLTYPTYLKAYTTYHDYQYKHKDAAVCNRSIAALRATLQPATV